LRLRAPLERGVTVIAAHCATEGWVEDLDNPPQSKNYFRSSKKVEAFDMFLRLMDEESYEGLLFGDISAINGWKRVGFMNCRYLTTLLNREDLHPRLVYGSDYPVPAANFVVSTIVLRNGGFITAAEKIALDEIYRYNPLLYDLLGKRLFRSPDLGKKFQDCIFKNDLSGGVEKKPRLEENVSGCLDPLATFKESQAARSGSRDCLDIDSRDCLDIDSRDCLDIDSLCVRDLSDSPTATGVLPHANSSEAVAGGRGSGRGLLIERGHELTLPFCFCLPSASAQVPSMPADHSEATGPIMPTVTARSGYGRSQRPAEQ